jgi:SET domain-containing protein
MSNLLFKEITESNGQYLDSTNQFSFVVRPSRIAGVGVFCTHAVKKGTRLRVFNGDKTIKIHKNEMSADVRQFAEFFGVEDSEGFFYVPDNYMCMSIGWYMNHSNNNNAFHDAGYKYFAARNIKAGEEITINYSDL